MIARALPMRMVEKVWGRDLLPAPFKASGSARIGEIWFEPPDEMPDLLVKYLFTSEKLSVQVHPSDADALSGERGKEECWLVLDAEPDAKLAIGFKKPLSPSQIEAAARDGTIEERLAWHSAAPGDVFYLPAGTVHAIGPGLTLVEVQQNSDTTFRLYDYGRPRELHLDRALAVADGGPYPVQHHGTVKGLGAHLINGPHFRLDRLEGYPDADLIDQYDNGVLALPLSGTISTSPADANAASISVEAGGCLYAGALADIDFSAAEVTLLTKSI